MREERTGLEVCAAASGRRQQCASVSNELDNTHRVHRSRSLALPACRIASRSIRVFPLDSSLRDPAYQTGLLATRARSDGRSDGEPVLNVFKATRSRNCSFRQQQHLTRSQARKTSSKVFKLFFLSFTTSETFRTPCTLDTRQHLRQASCSPCP